MIENRMVVENQWPEYGVLEPAVPALQGYHNMLTGEIVPDTDAYDYALEQCLHGNEEDRKAFRKELVEWFFSGNWDRRE